MKKIVLAALSLLMAAPAAPLMARKKTYVLEYNFSKGDEQTQRMVVDMTMDMDFMGMQTQTEIRMDMAVDFKVNDVRDTLYDVEVQYRNLKMSANVGGETMMEMDSDKEASGDVAVANALIGALVGHPIDFVFTKSGKAEYVGGFEAIFEEMANAVGTGLDDRSKRAMIDNIGKQFNDESLQQMFRQNAALFPGYPVKVGDSWNVKTEANTSVMPINVNMNMTLTRVKGSVATISGEGVISSPGKKNGILVTKPDAAAANSMPEVKVTGTQKGYVNIDLNTGWIVDGEYLQDFNMVMPGGSSTPQNVRSKITFSSK